ncbi:MAG: hypothetical protein AABM67_03690 [Acidobacteriota bacterium]
MNTTSPVAVILRGALGGVLGGGSLLLISVFEYMLSLGYVPYPYLFIVPGLPLALALGALAGGVVAGVVLLSRIVAGREFGPIGRGAIGFVTILIALVVIGLYGLLRAEDPVKSRFPRESVSWARQAANGVVIGIVLGVLPGLMARPKRVVGRRN